MTTATLERVKAAKPKQRSWWALVRARNHHLREMEAIMLPHCAWIVHQQRQTILDGVKRYLKAASIPVEMEGWLGDWTQVTRAGKARIKAPYMKVMEKSAAQTQRLMGVSPSFNVLDPNVLAYADAHAGVLITEVTAGTRAALRQTIASGIKKGKLFGQIRNDIGITAGLHSRQASAVLKIRDRLVLSGVSPDKVAKKVKWETTKRLRYRGRMITRTETAFAHTEGQLIAFKEEGIERLTPLLGPDPCDDCAAFEGQEFTVAEAAGQHPRHPQCTCDWVVAGSTPPVKHFDDSAGAALPSETPPEVQKLIREFQQAKLAKDKLLVRRLRAKIRKMGYSPYPEKAAKLVPKVPTPKTPGQAPVPKPTSSSKTWSYAENREVRDIDVAMNRWRKSDDCIAIRQRMFDLAGTGTQAQVVEPVTGAAAEALTKEMGTKMAQAIKELSGIIEREGMATIMDWSRFCTRKTSIARSAWMNATSRTLQAKPATLRVIQRIVGDWDRYYKGYKSALRGKNLAARAGRLKPGDFFNKVLKKKGWPASQSLDQATCGDFMQIDWSGNRLGRAKEKKVFEQFKLLRSRISKEPGAWVNGASPVRSIAVDVEYQPIRASCRGYQRIHVGTGERAGTWAHEFGHALETSSTGNHWQVRATRFRSSMAVKGAKPTQIPGGYAKGEVYLPDGWKDAYCARVYPSGHTEIVSMGVEKLWTNPVKFAQQEPKYFDFIVGLFEGAI